MELLEPVKAGVRLARIDVPVIALPSLACCEFSGKPRASSTASDSVGAASMNLRD